jgi:ABC-type uncharacterized transport system substrate-binding protein
MVISGPLVHAKRISAAGHRISKSAASSEPMPRPLLLILLLLVLVSRPLPANAHPHVWVKFHSEVLYAADGSLTGIRHAWTFDDMFSAYALQGIKHAVKGQYTREELTSLAQLNIKSLKEYDFFTYARAEGKKLKFSAPTDYWLEYSDSTLTLHFTLPLGTPDRAKDTQFEIYDPTIFVDFEFAKDRPVTLSGAPASCRFTLGLPHEPTASERLRLSQLDNEPLDPSSTYGETFANKITVDCP